MRILMDACVPRPLRRFLPDDSVSTAQEMGWGALKNGDLIARAEPMFDAMITSDQNIKYQQNIVARRIAILVLPTNDWPTILAHTREITDKVHDLQPGQFIELRW